MIPENVRAFLEQPHFAVMATVNADGAPQLTVMWYAILPDEDTVVLNASRGLLKVRNLSRDPRMVLCIEDGMRYVTLEGSADIFDDRLLQEKEVNELIAPRYLGQRMGSQRWDVISDSDRVGIHFHVRRFHAKGFSPT